MITPICTDTPNRARKPTPEETLKFACVTSSALLRTIGLFVKCPKAV